MFPAGLCHYLELHERMGDSAAPFLQTHRMVMFLRPGYEMFLRELASVATLYVYTLARPIYA